MSKFESIQHWFGSIIECPLTSEGHISSLTPLGKPIVEEAKGYIQPSNTLASHERIEIYNQQYWWRLYHALHQIFPLVTRIFGFHDFNERVATPYLSKHRPMSWSLNTIGNELPQWLDETYTESDKKFVVDSARIDLAYAECFLAAKKPLPSPQESLLTISLQLQPHVALFALDSHLFTFRDQMIGQEVKYWTENDFPKIESGQKLFFILYRSAQNRPIWEEVTPDEYTLLQLFQKKTTLEEALEKELPSGIEERLEEIFMKWGARGLLGKCDES